MTPTGGIKIAPRGAPEKIADAARDMGRLAGHTQERRAMRVELGPHRAALAAAMHDAMRHAPQRKLGARRERHRRRQPLEPRCDQAPCFCANTRASLILPRGGMVSTTSRAAPSMRSV